jgi:hypothetical protein
MIWAPIDFAKDVNSNCMLGTYYTLLFYKIEASMQGSKMATERAGLAVL